MAEDYAQLGVSTVSWLRFKKKKKKKKKKNKIGLYFYKKKYDSSISDYALGTSS